MKKFEPLVGGSHTSRDCPVLFISTDPKNGALHENGLYRLDHAHTVLYFLMCQCVDGDANATIDKNTVAELIGAAETLIADAKKLLKVAGEQAYEDRQAANTLREITQAKGLELCTNTLLGMLPKRVDGGLLTSFIGCTNAQEAARAWENMVSSLESRQ